MRNDIGRATTSDVGYEGTRVYGGQRLLRVVIETLTADARNLIRRAQIHDLSGFLSLGAEQLVSLPWYGLEVAEEILIAQDRVECLIRQTIRKKKRLTARQLRTHLPRDATRSSTGPGLPQSLQESAWESFANLSAMIETLVDRVCIVPREKTVLVGRLGLSGGRVLTLDELGTQLGVTRERVRQVEQRGLKALRSPTMAANLSDFWQAAREALANSCGVCSLEELAERLAQILEWDVRPDTQDLISVLRLSEDFDVDRKTRLVCDVRSACVRCDAVVSRLEELFAVGDSERQLPQVLTLIRSGCARTAECHDYSQSLYLTASFLHFVASKTERIRVKDNVVYSRDACSARRGSLRYLAERILRDAGKPMCIRDIYGRMRELRPNDTRVTERSVRQLVEKSKVIMNWDRGTFLHSAFATIPLDFANMVESWLFDRLGNGVPFVCVAGAFAQFRTECHALCITSESALYNCLRHFGSPQLCYPRCPQVYLADGFDARVPAVAALERYILDSGCEVAFAALRDYALNDLYLKGFQFKECLYLHAVDLAIAERGGYVRADVLRLDPLNCPD